MMYLNKSIFLLLTSIFSFQLLGQNTITIQPDYTDGQDAYVYDRYSTSNYGSSSEMDVYYSSGYRKRFFIKFDLDGLSFNQIESATLYLYRSANSWSDSRNITCTRVVQDWDEGSITWDNQPSVTTNGSITFTGGDVSGGFYQLDITSMIVEQLIYGSYGFRFAADESGYATDISVRSSEYGGSSTNNTYVSRRPKLIIVTNDNPNINEPSNSSQWEDSAGGIHYTDGNVGINTTDLSESILNLKGATNTAAGKTFAIRNSDGNPSLLVQDDQRTILGLSAASPHGGSLHAADRITVVGTATKSDIVFQAPNNNWGNLAMYNSRFQLTAQQPLWLGHTSNQSTVVLNTNGNVGIGTTQIDPDHKLIVNGFIKAKEVRVSQDGWADYVFKPTYPLMPLPDLRNYINKHGTLPNIPDEKTVKSEGIQVGEMHKKLLEKIEELTLYILQQEERISRLEIGN